MAHFLCAKQPQSTASQSSAVLFRDATVVAVQAQYFDVIIPEYNIEKRIHLAHLPVYHHTYEHGALTIHWRKGVPTPTGNCITHLQQDFDYEDDDGVVDEDALAEEMKEGEPTEAAHGVPLKQTFQHHHSAVTVSRRVAPTTRRASVLRARLSDSTAYSVEQASQTLKALDQIKVVVIVEMSKSPPTLRVLAANPFA
ncbi:hypothetical protein BX666DRAFT_1934542 [Dichotomocladium elegans]|nr:hypothetical protein BX666DRAFT_1934542 [Dichotomocladium elegans]